MLVDAKALEALLNGVDHYHHHHLGGLGGQQEELLRSKSLPADFRCFSDTGRYTLTHTQNSCCSLHLMLENLFAVFAVSAKTCWDFFIYLFFCHLGQDVTQLCHKLGFFKAIFCFSVPAAAKKNLKKFSNFFFLLPVNFSH